MLPGLDCNASIRNLAARFKNRQLQLLDQPRAIRGAARRQTVTSCPYINLKSSAPFVSALKPCLSMLFGCPGCDYSGPMIENDTTDALAFSEPSGLELSVVIEGVGQKSLSAVGHEAYRSLLTGFTESATLRLLGNAFAYRVGIDWSGKHGFRANLEPEVPAPDSWPTELKSVPSPVLETWSYLYSHIGDPVVKAHFGDLVLSASRRPDLSMARFYASIIETVLQDHSWNQNDRYLMAVRAVSICNQFKLLDLRQSVLAAIRREIQNVLDNRLQMSKSFLWLFRSYRVAMALSAPDEQARVNDDLLYDQFWQQLRLMKVEDYVAEDLLAVAKDQEHKKEIQSRHVQTKIDAGQAAPEAFQKLHHFESAASLAKRYALPELHGEAVRLLQESRELEPQWEKVERSEERRVGKECPV